MIRVSIAADTAALRSEMRMALAGDRQISVVAEISDVSRPVPQAGRIRPQVAVIQPRRGGLGDPELRRAIRRLSLSGTRVVARASVTDADHLMRALRAGVSGFVYTDADSDDLATVVRAASGTKYLPNPAATQRLLATDPGVGCAGDLAVPEGVERQVLGYIGAGLPNVEIAAALGLHPTTTYAYTNHLMAKFGVRGRMQLAICAHDRGLIPVG